MREDKNVSFALIPPLKDVGLPAHMLRLRNVVAGGCSGCYSIADNIALKRTKAPVEHKVDGTGVYAPRLRRDWEICLPSAVRHASS